MDLCSRATVFVDFDSGFVKFWLNRCRGFAVDLCIFAKYLSRRM